ncbi:MAG TPA: polymer-forming cytoskeletal protein, partial [Actinomycetota bacterium]|nr:polymer-forming cytoskeletal protein [Actinomycetota bacterium]
MKIRALPRFAFVLGFLAAVCAISIAPAFAAGDAGTSIGPQVVIEGRAVVVPNESAGSIVIFDGPVIVAGTVNGSVVAFHGTVTIAGTVRGDVVSVSDRVIVLPAAHVTGDVRSR